MTVHKQQTAQGFSRCKNTKQLGTLCTFENQRLYRHSRLKKSIQTTNNMMWPHLYSSHSHDPDNDVPGEKKKQTKETIKKQEIS